MSPAPCGADWLPWTNRDWTAAWSAGESADRATSPRAFTFGPPEPRGPPKPARPPSGSMSKRSMRSTLTVDDGPCARLRPANPAASPSVRLAPLEADGLPAAIDSGSNERIAAEQSMSDLARAIGKGLHPHVRRRTESGERVVPDLADGFPAPAAEGLAGGAEGEIGRAAAVVRIHARRDLGVLRRLRRQAVLGRRIGHVAQADEALCLGVRPHDVGTDQPVGGLDVLLLLPLPEHRAEADGHALVEAAGLALVGELQRVLGDAVRQLVADDVVAGGEVDEDIAVAIAVHH